jgi:hypothetical protein
MIRDPVVEEIHKIRQEHAAKFDFNLAAICDEYRELETKSPLEPVSLPARPPLKQTGS